MPIPPSGREARRQRLKKRVRFHSRSQSPDQVVPIPSILLARTSQDSWRAVPRHSLSTPSSSSSSTSSCSTSPYLSSSPLPSSSDYTLNGPLVETLEFQEGQWVPVSSRLIQFASTDSPPKTRVPRPRRRLVSPPPAIHISMEYAIGVSAA